MALVVVKRGLECWRRTKEAGGGPCIYISKPGQTRTSNLVKATSLPNLNISGSVLKNLCYITSLFISLHQPDYFYIQAQGTQWFDLQDRVPLLRTVARAIPLNAEGMR